MKKRTVVVAVGGNALIADKNNVSTQAQAETVARTCGSIVQLVDAGYTPVITHGNGPQVGFLLRRVELSSKEVPPVPLDVLGADTQGATGYMFSRNLRARLEQMGHDPKVVAVVTQTVVDPKDPAFGNPSKPIGSFMGKEEAEMRCQTDGWSVMEDSGRGWRRVVASPNPLEIVEADAIASLLEAGFIVIACGGGGIPVRREGEELIGVEAVIDKDLSSALLGNELKIDDLVICTGVDNVYINFGTPRQEKLTTLTVHEAQTYLDAQQFAVGSMEPKVRAAIEFIQRGGKRAVITSLENAAAALQGNAGTVIVSD